MTDKEIIEAALKELPVDYILDHNPESIPGRIKKLVMLVNDQSRIIENLTNCLNKIPELINRYKNTTSNFDNPNCYK